MARQKGKTNKTLVEEIYNFFKQSPNQQFNYKQIAKAVGASNEGDRKQVNFLLETLSEQKLLEKMEHGKYKLKAGEHQVITGKIEITQNGTGYVTSEDLEEDLLISERYLKTALTGDIVKAKVFPTRSGRRAEGEVIEVVQRTKTDYVGNITITKQYAFVVPDSQKMNIDFFVPIPKIGDATDGQKVVVRFVRWDEGQKNPEGEVIKVLGKPGDNETEIHAILEEFALPYEFPEEVLSASEAIPVEITEEEIANRRDFRKITTFTIDPFDAKDFDDAISFQKLANGNYEIGVHIADVSHYVTPGSVIDREAIERATSVYLVDRVVPMLPEVLSNVVCSLRPNEDKLCFSAVFEINEEAEVIRDWFGRTVIHSIRRFSYEEAQEIIETGAGDLKEEILTVDRLAKIMRKQRFKHGAIAFEKQEVKFKLDEKGKPLGVYFKVAKDSNHLIEEFMLLANRRVAEYVGKPKHNKDKKGEEAENTFVYRIHDKPNEDKLDSFLVLVRKLGYQFNSGSPSTISKSMNKLMADVKEKPESGMIEQLAIRTMSKAIYTTQNIGHYGLAFDYYTHFTSPIRRYPDVMAHRLLAHYLAGGKSPDPDFYEGLCEQSSDREKVAADAERASIKFKQVEYMKERVGMTFSGVITGVTEWGLFIELNANKCEGMVRLKDLTSDFYIFDEDNFCVTGKRSKRVYALGDKVKVEVKRADVIRKQIDLTMVEE